MTREEALPALADEEEEVILVDDQDRPIGFDTKRAVHESPARLHRAFSVFLFDRDGRLLLQRRARTKYHFRGLWTNTCCSHPRKGEATPEAAHRRLHEEFGIRAPLTEVFRFRYEARDTETGLTEREWDHVFIGTFTGTPCPDAEEIEDWKWVAPSDLLTDLDRNPAAYTPWLRFAVERGILSRAAAPEY